MSYNYLSFANAPYVCNNLLPGGITNFGGDTQVFTVPEDIRNGQIGMYLNQPALDLVNTQNNTVWNNWGATGVNPYSATAGAAGGGISTTSTTGNPFIDNMVNIANQYQANAAQNTATGALSEISKFKQALYGQLYKQGISEDDANKINAYITKLEDAEQKMLKADEEYKNGTIDASEYGKAGAEAQKVVSDIKGEIANTKNIEATLKNIEKASEKLSSIEARTDLTAPAKERLKEIKTKLEEIKSKVDELKKNPDKKEPTEINNELRKLCVEYNAVLSALNQISGGQVPASTTAGNKDKVDGRDKADKSDKADKADKKDKTQKTEGKGGDDDDEIAAGDVERPSSSKTGYSKEGRDIVDLFDSGNIDEACAKINSDNIMDVMLAWQDLYSAEYNQSFMERFIDKAGYSQKRKIGAQIRNALRDKALELGIHDECREDLAKINKEVKSTFWFSNGVSENYDNIIKKIAKAEGKKYVETPKND